MDYPTTIFQAVNRLLSALTDVQKEGLRSTSPQDLWRYHYSLGRYICNELGLCAGNDELVRSCYQARGKGWIPFDSPQPDDPSEIIIDALWARLYV